jgi:hypothetical protein
MREKNEAIFRRWIDEVWNKGIEKTVDELFAENAVANYQYRLGRKPIQGNEEYKKFIRFIRKFFAEILVRVEQVVTEKNKVVAFLEVTAKRRHFKGAELPVPSTIKASGLCQVIIESDQIIQSWSNIDLLGSNEPKKNGVTG